MKLNMNDIEFLMYAMNCVNSEDREIVRAFRSDMEHVKRLADLAGQLSVKELNSKLDEIRGLAK